MANLQKTLDALQPYVIGIRYLDGLPVVDAVFKDDWTLPESNIIHRVKGNNDVNYYMLFSETEGIGLDELLSYVDITIKANIEKEKKHELLKEKVNELKELFKRTPLTKLQRLKFSFSDEDLMPELNDLNPDEEILEEREEIHSIISQPPIVAEEDVKQLPTIEENLTDEEREILEEERRAENYKTYQQNQKNTSQLESIKKKVELPPRKTIEAELVNKNESCDCELEEACVKCIDKKSL